MKDVGYLTVKIFEAQGLAALDIGGKSDPFCVLELVNARLQVGHVFRTPSRIIDNFLLLSIIRHKPNTEP